MYAHEMEKENKNNWLTDVYTQKKKRTNNAHVLASSVFLQKDRCRPTLDWVLGLIFLILGRMHLKIHKSSLLSSPLGQ